MKHLYFLLTIVAFSLVVRSQSLSRQDALKVFIDCPECDMDYIRENLTFVNYVRESREADVIILTNTQNTASKGLLTSVFFIGQQGFSDKKDTLTFGTLADDTEDRYREKMLKYLKIGLIPYVNKIGTVEHIEVVYNAPETENEETTDKWHGWVFQTSLSGWGNAEKTYNSYNINSSLNIEKITEKFKTENLFQHSYAESNYMYDDFTYKNRQLSYYLNSNNVFSLNAHWSAGLFVNGWSSLYNNIYLQGGIRPAIEYNLFPYSDASSRQLRISYSMGPVYNIYNDSTIYNKTEELLFRNRLNLSTEFVKQWGRIWLYVSYAHYLHDITLNSININSNISWRIAKGLELSYYMGYGIIHDQISLTKDGATQEELLLQQKELKTDFTFWTNFGLSYTFGNIYNNVVNPRFGN